MILWGRLFEGGAYSRICSNFSCGVKVGKENLDFYLACLGFVISETLGISWQISGPVLLCS